MRNRVLTHLWRDKKVAVGVLVLGAEVLIASFSFLVAPYDPEAQVFDLLEAPSVAHLLGTDEFGRDLLSRLIAGARISLTVGISSVMLAMLVGIPLGLLAGYYGGWVDLVIMRYIDFLWAFPALIIAVGLMAIFGAGLGNVIAALALAYIDDFARIMRGVVLGIREEDYITAAKAIGCPDRRIVLRQIVPNSMAPVIVQGTVSVSFAILAESTLSFLGLGVEITTPTWGLILAGARGFFTLAWWLGIFPGLAIMITVLSINFVGDGLRDILDVKEVREAI